MKKLNIIKSLSFSFTVLKKNSLVVLLPTLAVMIINITNYIIKQLYYPFAGSNILRIWKTVPLPDLILFELLLPFVFIALTFIILIVFSKISFQAYEKDKVSLKEIHLPNFPIILKYLLLVIVFTSLQFVGFLLLLIPGFIFSITYFWVFFIFIEENSTSIKELFGKSAVLSKDIRWSMFGYFFLMFIALQGLGFSIKYLFSLFIQSGNPIVIQGIIMVILTLIFTPIVALSLTYLYKDLKDQQANNMQKV
jgi:hypothetical protein